MTRRRHASIVMASSGMSPGVSAMNSFVYYAYEVVLDADKMSSEDALRLHSLGVAWSGKICAGACKTGDINRNLF